MIRFLYGDLLWRETAKRTKKAQRTKAAIAYVTKPSILAFRSGDALVVDATDGAIASGQTSAAAVSALFKKGVSLYSHTGLHAKVVIADSELFSSSANLSESSVSKLLEAGIETDNPSAVSGAVGMIEKLIETSVKIAPAFIARIKKIKVKKRFGGGKSKARATGENHRRDPVTWLLGVHTVDDPKNPEELRRIERGTAKAEEFRSNPKGSTSWIRYGHKDRVKEALLGDNVVAIHRESDRANPQRVYHHAPVCWSRKSRTVQGCSTKNCRTPRRSPCRGLNSRSWRRSSAFPRASRRIRSGN